MIIASRPKQMTYAALAALIFLILAVAVRADFILPKTIDTAISNFLTNTQTSFGSAIMNLVSFLGGTTITVIYALIIAGIFFLANLKIPAIWVMATMLSGDVAGYILKQIIDRSRPIQHLISDEGPSFPSGHSLGTWLIIAILFVAIIPNINRTKHRLFFRWGLITFGLLVLLSRIYLGAHYLTDTLAGALFAIAWVGLTTALYPYIANFLVERIPFLQSEEI